MRKKVDAEPEGHQHARFLETARALGCDEDEAAFDEQLKGIARPVTKDEPKVKPAKS